MPDTPDPTDDAPINEGVYDDIPEATPEQEFMGDLAGAFEATEEHYTSFDPREVIDAAQTVDTVDEVAGADRVVEFDPRYRETFEGLLYLGMLKKRFKWMGHEFVIRTLLTNEIVEVGVIQKPYVGTLGEMKAYQAASVAAAVLSVDGQPLPIPISDEDSSLEARFTYVMNHWSPIIIDMLYGQCLELEQEVHKVLAAMGKAPG